MVRLAHVLEHVPEPVEALAALRPHVTPQGRLVVAVPNTDSAVAELFGADWLNLDAPRHVWGFNEKNLRMTFDKAGYDVEQVIFNGIGASVYESMRYALTSKESRGHLGHPSAGPLLHGLDLLADEWNSQGAGDWMVMTGKVKNG